MKQKLPQTLTTEWKRICAFGFSLLIVFNIFFTFLWPLDRPLQWLLQAGLIWLWVSSRVYRYLELNRSSSQRPKSAVFDQLGWANRLTILRGFLIAVTGGFIFQRNLDNFILIIPALSYFIAAIIDRIDGYVARKSGQESLLGSKLDVENDALGLLIAPLLAVWIGQIHWSYLSVSLAYYFFQYGLFWRKQRNLPVFELPLNMSRRAIAGFQMGFLAVVLWPILAPPASTIAGIAFMIPLLGGFYIDWLTVSGRLNPEDSRVKLIFLHIDNFFRNIFIPLLRIFIISMVYFSLQSNGAFTFGAEAESGTVILAVTILFAAIMITLGVNGRFFAVILSCLLAWFFLSHPMNFLDALMLVSVIWVMQLGTGGFSLYRWDDKWVNRYDGA